MASVECNGMAFASPLCIPKGKTAKFTLEGFPLVAIPSWTAAGGLPASGKGPEFSCAFNAAGSVTVICAGVPVPITFQVQVFEVEFTLTPEDAFGGRAADKFGVDERVALKAKPTSNIAVADVGGIRWEIKGPAGRSENGVVQKSSGDATAPNDSGTAYYIAPFTTGDAPNERYFRLKESKDITLKAVIAGGPFKGHAFEKTIKVFAPRAHMVVMAGSEMHAHNFPSAGFIGLIHLHPTNVSFRTLEWSESVGFAVAKGVRSGIGQGYFKYDHNKKHEPSRKGYDANRPAAERLPNISGYERGGALVADGNSQTGCWVRQRDQVWTGYNNTWAPRGAVPAAAAAAALVRVRQPAVLARVAHANPAFLADELSLGGGGPNEMVEPSEVQWPIDWQYRVKNAPAPEPNRWIVFQVVVHKGETDGTGTTRISKGSPGQAWTLAQVSRNLGDPNKGAPVADTYPNDLACVDP